MSVTVSAESLHDAVNTISTTYKPAFDTALQDGVKKYSEMTTSGTLSSANIDVIVAGINNEINKLETSFNQTITNITSNVTDSGDVIQQSTQNVESALNNVSNG